MGKFYTDLEINELNLDEENIKQPILAMEYHEKSAKVQKERDDLKLELEVLEAQIDKEIRDTSEKKPTETQISNMIIMDPRRIKKVKELNEKIEEVNIIRGAVESFDDRKKSLQNLTTLFVSGYFGQTKKTKVENVRTKIKGVMNGQK